MNRRQAKQQRQATNIDIYQDPAIKRVVEEQIKAKLLKDALRRRAIAFRGIPRFLESPVIGSLEQSPSPLRQATQREDLYGSSFF